MTVLPRLSAVIAVAVLLAGCATAPPAAPRPDAQPTVVDCAADSMSGLSQTPPGTPPGRVPNDFNAIAAMRCIPMDTIEDDQGTWSAITTERLEGDLGRLLDALDEPDDGRSAGPCTLMEEIVPPLWLVDAHGISIRVHYPVDGCGFTKPGVAEALEQLTVIDRSSIRSALIESRAAMESGCPTTWYPVEPLVVGDLGPGVPVAPPPAPVPDVRAPGEPVPPASSGITAVPYVPPTLPPASDVEELQLCRYDAIAGDGPVSASLSIGETAVGQFVDARRIAPEETRLALSLLEEAQAVQACTDTATRYAVLFPIVAGTASIAAVTIERDGCQRLLVPGGEWSAAPAELLTLVG